MNATYTSITATDLTNVYTTSCPSYGKVPPDQQAFTFVGTSRPTFLLGNDVLIYTTMPAAPRPTESRSTTRSTPTIILPARSAATSPTPRAPRGGPAACRTTRRWDLGQLEANLTQQLALQ